MTDFRTKHDELYLDELAEITINDKGDMPPRNEIKTFITPANPIYNDYMQEKSGKHAINYGVANKQSSEEFLGDELPF